MLENQRHLFDIPQNVHYLNCAYMSPLLKSAVAAGHQAVSLKSTPWKISPTDFFTQSDKARALFAGLIGAQQQDIAIIPSVSYGTAIAALNLPLAKGDKVLFLAEEFPSNLYAWRVKTKAVGASILFVERPADNNWTQAVLAALSDPQVNIAVLPQTHWIDGGMLDLELIAAARQQHNFALVLDLTQSLGVLGVNVERLQADFLICATYKWLLGPYSLGFVYVHPKHQQGIPIEQGWVNRPGAEDFSRLIDYVDELNSDASRFDMGERANFHLIPMAIAGLEQIHQWGHSNIAAALRSYSSALQLSLKEIGFTACDEALRAPNYLSVWHEKTLPDKLLQRLLEDNIYISKRGDSLRISPHLYNNEQDSQQLVTALSKFIKEG